MGTRYLQATLNSLLAKHIKEKMPGIRSTLELSVRQLTDELKEMGYPEETQLSKIKLLYNVLQRFTTELKADIEGMSLDVSVNMVNSGVAINKVIYRDIYSIINASVQDPTESDITIALANMAGYRCRILPNQLAIDLTVRDLTEKYKEPLKDATNKIKGILIAGIMLSVYNLSQTF